MTIINREKITSRYYVSASIGREELVKNAQRSYLQAGTISIIYNEDGSVYRTVPCDHLVGVRPVSDEPGATLVCAACGEEDPK